MSLHRGLPSRWSGVAGARRSHFYLDGNKGGSVHGTVLAWLGDPAAKDYARHAAARHEVGGQSRRLATAYLTPGSSWGGSGDLMRRRTAGDGSFSYLFAALRKRG